MNNPLNQSLAQQTFGVDETSRGAGRIDKSMLPSSDTVLQDLSAWFDFDGNEGNEGNVGMHCNVNANILTLILLFN
jgi:hypothetical protein